MTPEKKRTTAKALSLVVIMGGSTVVAGWIFDIAVLKSISPSWVTMKMATAITFVLSGITLYFIVRDLEGEREKAQVVFSLTSLMIILFMGTLFFSALLKMHTGVEDLFVKEPSGAVRTVTPGRPSVPTMFNFILMAVAGMATMLHPAKLQSYLRRIGLIVAATGALAVVGYVTDVPLLYYYLEGINSAVALHTAILFVLLGTGLLCL